MGYEKAMEYEKAREEFHEICADLGVSAYSDMSQKAWDEYWVPHIKHCGGIPLTTYKEKPVSDLDIGVVRASRWVGLDEIKPGMTLLDTTTGRERTVVSVSTTVKGEYEKSVSIKFASASVTLKYSVNETTQYDSFSRAGHATKHLSPFQYRFKEAYDLDVSKTVKGIAQKIVDKAMLEALTAQVGQHLEPTPAPKKKRWFR